MDLGKPLIHLIRGNEKKCNNQSIWEQQTRSFSTTNQHAYELITFAGANRRVESAGKDLSCNDLPVGDDDDGNDNDDAWGVATPVPEDGEEGGRTSLRALSRRHTHVTVTLEKKCGFHFL